MDPLIRTFMQHGLPDFNHPVLHNLRQWNGEYKKYNAEFFADKKKVASADIKQMRLPYSPLTSALLLLQKYLSNTRRSIHWDRAFFPEQNVSISREELYQTTKSGFPQALSLELEECTNIKDMHDDDSQEELAHVYLRLTSEFFLAADNKNKPCRHALFDQMMLRLHAAVAIREHQINISPEPGT